MCQRHEAVEGICPHSRIISILWVKTDRSFIKESCDMSLCVCDVCVCM